MAKKNLAFGFFVFLVAPCILISSSFAQDPTSNQDTTPTSTSQISLAQFVNETFKAMGLDDDFSLPGLSDASGLLLSNYTSADKNAISADVSVRGIPLKVIQFTPSGKTKPILIISAKKFNLSKAIPGIGGTPLGAMGELENVGFIYSPKEFAGKLHNSSSSGSDGGSSIPNVVVDALGSGGLSTDILPGMNMTASVSTSKISREIQELFKSVGISQGKTISIGGKISPNILKKFIGKNTDEDSMGGAPSSGLVNSSQMKNKIRELLTDYGQDFLSHLEISGDLPKNLRAGPLDIKNGQFVLKGGQDGKSISFGVAAEDAIVSKLDVKNLHITYDADKKEVSSSGEVDQASLAKMMNFKGLKLDKIALASTYAKNAWSLQLGATAELHGKILNSDISLLKAEAGQTQFQVMLDGGPSGISAKDIAGRDVPGFDKVALSKVMVTNERLVADLLFGAKKTKGEIAAFHVGALEKPVLAVTLDSVSMTDLMPGSAGNELEGVSVEGMTLVVVPPKGGGIQPNNPSIPKEIVTNLLKVISDAATHDPKMHSFTLHEGINLLADLDIAGSKGLGSLMASGGLTETKIPIVGTLSLSTFSKTASKADRLKGLSLLAGLPDLKVPGLPSTITITHPIFAITETAPEALKQPEGSPPATGPFITIGADLVMQASGKTHEFDALLMVGKDEQGKEIIDLIGSAKDAKGLFKFKGLSVKTLELASMYEGGNWDFQLHGAADLNGKELDFDTDIKKDQGKVEYIATLTGGKDGISAKDVAGHDVPGFDKVALSKVVVTNDRLVADLLFGAKKTPGELAAFHPGTLEKAVLAVTIDKVELTDLLPGKAGSELEGVSVEGMTLVVVPPKEGGIQPNDQAIPEEIASNLSKVITDAATHDPKMNAFTLHDGINLLADLDIKGSKGLGSLMASGGLTETKIPIVGTLSLSTFDKTATKADRLKGLSLLVGLPDLKVPGLPSSIKITHPIFAITESSPDALKQPAGSPAPEGPFISIGADLVMQASGKTHEFDALLMVGKDEQGKEIIDLIGSAKDVQGLFKFKGLTAKTLELASMYDGGKWDFQLEGTADLNGKELDFATEIKKEQGKVEYIATLTAGKDGISAKDVAGHDVPGFDKVALTKLLVKNDRLVADLLFGTKKTPGELAAFHPGTLEKAVLAVTIDKVELTDLVPGKAGSELEGVSVEGMTLVVVPPKGGGIHPNDPAIPEEISTNLTKVITDAATHDPKMHAFTLHDGINLLADLDIKGSKGLGSLMASGGLTETKIPIVGTVSLSTFSKTASKADRLKGLSLEVGLPDLKVPGLPSTIKITNPIFAITETAPDALKQPAGSPAPEGPFISIGADLVMQASGKKHEFDALLMVGKDEKGKEIIDLLGSAKAPKGLFKFKGLTEKTLELACIYEAGSWDFQLKGTADLNGKELDFDTEIKKDKGKIEYIATLTGGKDGISAKDVAGHDVPGFDKVALTKILVTNGRLVADLLFGTKKTPGELAAFHPGTLEKAVLALTIDKIDLTDVIPGSAGKEMEGVSIDGLTLVVVPPKGGGIHLNDPAIPEEISTNLTKVITDAATHDPKMHSFTLHDGINLLADLDIKGSKGLGSLMASGGLTETKIPIVGTVSLSTFSKTASKADKLKGLSLLVGLPDLKVPGLPSTITITHPIFAITENAPDALKQPADSPAPVGPFITIGADLVMQASGKKHEFDALLMVGKDEKGKEIIDLMGSAKSPIGLFKFKGLTVKTLELACIFEAGSWDFRLAGTSDLNGDELDFDTEIKKDKGKVTYIATLSGGKNGISAKDVAGRDVPGFDEIALTKVIVSGERLVADFLFGAKKEPGELAAFHPNKLEKAVLAMTMDKIEVSELIPGSADNELDGVGFADLTVVVVPPKGGGFKLDDPALPKELVTNLTKVLTDSNKLKGFAFKDDFNFFGELELKPTGPMGDLMKFIGEDPKKGIAITGVMSRNLFNKKVKGADRYKGMELSVQMPGLNLSKLPGAFTFKNAELLIKDKDPTGVAGLWVGIQSDLTADLFGKKLAFTSDIGFRKGGISLEAKSDTEFDSPFGIKWLSLKNLDLLLEYDKKAGSGEIIFTGIPTKPIGKSTPKISIELKETKGKLSAGVLKIDEKVPFTDLPILKGIPHADQFDFTFLEISTHGVSGGSLLHGEEVDAVVFEQNGKWTFAVSDNGGGNGFKFGRIMPALSKTPLGDFHLNDAALIFSQTDISEKLIKLPEVAHTVFKDIYGSTDAMVKITNGITVAANFSPANSSGFASNGLKGVGIHDDILIEGSIENIFGGKGAPGVDILVQVEQGPGGSKGASHSPKMAKFPGEVGFFIQYKADELDVGLAADVVLHLPKKQSLTLETKLELELNEKGFAVDIFMDLKGKWDEPFGIPGIDLEEVAIKFGIDMEGEAVFGVAGKCELADGAERIDIAAEMDFELEAAGLPDGIAMRGSITELGIPALIDVAERMAGGGANLLPPNDIPLPEFRDVVFAFATPGVSDPQLGLVGSGFKLAGELFFMGRELGKVDLHAGPTGIKLDASIDPIDLEVIKLEENQLKFDLGFKSLPKLEIDSIIELLGDKQTVLVKFDKGMVDMTFEDKIGGGIWDSTITLGFGFDASHKGAPDIFIEGEVKEDFFGWLADKAPEKVKEFFAILTKKFEEAKAAIDNAEAVVRSWNGKIAARKAAVQREKANADAAIHRAESRVDSVLKDVHWAKDKAHSEGHKCHWYSPWHCAEEAYYWVRYGIEYAAYEIAEGVLHAAQAAIDHLPAELMDPELDALEIGQAAAMVALEIAKAVISGVELITQWIGKGLESLLKVIGESKALVIKEIFFEGDMDGMLKGDPMILSIDLEVFGDDLGTQMFAFKLTDPLFDAEQLAFIPLHMVSELFKKFLPGFLKKLLGPVLLLIDAQSKAAMKKVHDELKDMPGLKLPPDVQKALDAAKLYGLPYSPNEYALFQPGSDNPFLPNNRYAQAIMGTKYSPDNLNGIAGYPRVASLYNPDTQIDSGESWITVAQNPAKPSTTNTGVSTDTSKPPAKTSAPKIKAKPGSKLDAFQKRQAAFREKRRNLLVHITERNKRFGESYLEFAKNQEAERAKNENDMYVAHTDVRVPPGELFTEKLLVARHSKLCLGQDGQGKITFHPCSDNPGGLLWATKRILVDIKGHVIPWDETFAQNFPNRVYSQLIHNGACLTTPFHLQQYDTATKEAHQIQLTSIAKAPPANQLAHLTLSGCRNDAKGQLWKVVKDTTEKGISQHGFKIQERDSGFCLRPDSVKAQTNKTSKQVNAVFYPCTGVAQSTFELTVPNNEMPIWYDHNGVIKSEGGYCLDVPDDPVADSSLTGSAVYMKKCTNDKYDRWDYVVEYDKTVKIINDYTGHCLYPYDVAEGKIPNVKAGQLVQRPCDARYNQGWKMRVIPKQKWFQLEALDSSKKGTNKCMIPEVPNPKEEKLEVYIDSCTPQSRGRWQFGHWKGTYEWTEWTSSEADTLTTTFWISKDNLVNRNRNGVCRVLLGNPTDRTHYITYPGTWHGAKGVCSYVESGAVKNVIADQPGGNDILVEVLSGLDIGLANSSGLWKRSVSGIPLDSTGQNKVPPNPEFSPFLAGWDNGHPALYLCRQMTIDKIWRYGYQGPSSKCTTSIGFDVQGDTEVLVFNTIKNENTAD